MATKLIPAEVAADRAAAMSEYQKDRLAALQRMKAQRAARLARDARLAKRGKTKAET